MGAEVGEGREFLYTGLCMFTWFRITFFIRDWLDKLKSKIGQ